MNKALFSLTRDLYSLKRALHALIRAYKFSQKNPYICYRCHRRGRATQLIRWLRAQKNPYICHCCHSPRMGCVARRKEPLYMLSRLDILSTNGLRGTTYSNVWHMGWLRLVGALKLYVSFAEYSLFYRALLQKRLIILRSPLIVATP